MINIGFKTKISMLLALLAAAIILGLTMGAANIPLPELLKPENRAIFSMRVLRVLVALLAGAGLSVSGVALQAILRNPLAEPYLLGTSSGAGLAAVVAVILGVSRLYLTAAAFLGALLSIVIVYAIAYEKNRASDKSLILSGVIVSVAFSSLIVFLVSLFGNLAMHEINWWLWGNLQTTDAGLVAIVSVPVICGIIGISFFSQDLNAISMGEEEAQHLGIDIQNVKKIVIMITALVTASLICVCGIIGFVGLIVPHTMRLITGPNHKRLIPATCLASGIFMIICDLISRTLFSPVEIPIGVITAIIGTPVFVLLLKRGRAAR